MRVNENGYLQNGNKLVMVQVGKEIFSLQHYKTIDNSRRLEVILNQHDVRLLKDKKD